MNQNPKHVSVCVCSPAQPVRRSGGGGGWGGSLVLSRWSVLLTTLPSAPTRLEDRTQCMTPSQVLSWEGRRGSERRERAEGGEREKGVGGEERRGSGGEAGEGGRSKMREESRGGERGGWGSRVQQEVLVQAEGGMNQSPKTQRPKDPQHTPLTSILDLLV